MEKHCGSGGGGGVSFAFGYGKAASLHIIITTITIIVFDTIAMRMGSERAKKREKKQLPWNLSQFLKCTVFVLRACKPIVCGPSQWTCALRAKAPGAECVRACDNFFIVEISNATD